MAALVYAKWSEGRVSFFGLKSQAHIRIDAAKEKRALERKDTSILAGSENNASSDRGHDVEDHKNDDHKGTPLDSPTTERQMYPVLLEENKN